jgi:hypothetical protein
VGMHSEQRDPFCLGLHATTRSKEILATAEVTALFAGT